MNRARTKRHDAGLPQQIVLGVIALAAAAPFALIASIVPPPLVVASMSLAALGGAALVAVYAAWRKAAWSCETVTAWDVAGGLALVGFCAAMLSEPAHVLQLSTTAVAMN
jgi:hypothetical protein